MWGRSSGRRPRGSGVYGGGCPLPSGKRSGQRLCPYGVPFFIFVDVNRAFWCIVRTVYDLKIPNFYSKINHKNERRRAYVKHYFVLTVGNARGERPVGISEPYSHGARKNAVKVSVQRTSLQSCKSGRHAAGRRVAYISAWFKRWVVLSAPWVFVGPLGSSDTTSGNLSLSITTAHTPAAIYLVYDISYDSRKPWSTSYFLFFHKYLFANNCCIKR